MTEVQDRTILFVDDEPNVLTAIRRGLRKHASRGNWNLTFADNAKGALEQMACQSVDIVVSDITMPNINGVSLMQQIRDSWPDTVRILMSGTANSSILMQSVPVAHRFLNKPWNVKSLQNDLLRAFELRDFMDNKEIREVIGSVTALPVLPDVYQKLCTTLENPTSRIHDVVSVVENDPSVVARLLHIVNSAFFAAPRPMHSTEDAVRYLGTSLLRSLVLTSEIFNHFDVATLPREFHLNEVQIHALLTAKLAAQIADNNVEIALSAGLLHSIGKLIFADRIPDQWGPAFRESRTEERRLVDVEMHYFDTNYAQVGGYLLGLWGLPQDLVEAVAHHGIPTDNATSNLATVTHIASAIAAEHLEIPGCSFAKSFLDSIVDCPEKLDRWRALAIRLTE